MLNKKSLLLLFSLLVVAIIFLSSCTQRQIPEENSIPPISSSPKENRKTTTGENIKQQKIFTINEISKHNMESNCWIVIHDKVYNITPFISSHPGGKAILQGCGKDATGLYETRPMGSGTPHSDKARNELNNFYIGNLTR